MTSASTLPSRGARVAIAVLSAAFIAAFFTHAWVVDDAYITFRTIDNFVNGYGLRWNVDERVQTYTHPLWMFLCSGIYVFTHEVFYTVLGLSFVVSLLALVVTARGVYTQSGTRGVIVLLCLLLASKAYVDFNSSGLENPLTHLLLGAFFVRFLSERRPWHDADGNEALVLYVLAALCFVNRQDTAVIFAPACALVLFDQVRARGLRAWRPLAIGALPALGWVVFSLVYYGSAVPNTAYAKLISAGLTAAERWTMGYGYVVNSLKQDPLTLPLCIVAIGLCTTQGLRRRDPAPLMAALGIIAYLVYVLKDGATGTHMGGRFLSAPVMLAAVSVAMGVRARRSAAVFVASAVLTLIASPRSPLRVATPWYDHTTVPNASVIDTRDYAQREGTSLIDTHGRLRTIDQPAHPAYAAGLATRSSDQRVILGGPGKAYAMMVGFSGYAAGPGKHIIDHLGLTDPLLARLPLAQAAQYRPGHFFRALPTGYRLSVQLGKNKIADPDLRRVYGALLRVTRDPLWSTQRFQTIWGLHTGVYDPLVRAYAARNGLR